MNTTDAPTPIELSLSTPRHSDRQGGAVAQFRHDSDEGWTVEGTVSRGPHGHVISHLQIWPGRPGDPPGASITSRVLGSIRVGTIIDAVRYWEMRERLRAKVADTAYDPSDETMSRVVADLFTDTVRTPATGVTIRTADEILASAPPVKPQPGRAPLPDVLLRQVAEGYLAESAPGKPRGAVKRLAQQLGRPEQTVSRWVSRARKEGWLGPARPGSEGAEPGRRLLAVQAGAESAVS
jgi:hypothetical protein